ncbi:hypothetical protein [Desulfosporosinus meridiei]|uniref:Uncharacterized protein n=1 Tax=Desulfosporosinus meridiei (strain ATCC BAA-275 / DSM 13257 / KCTC 12902 / NCIMB 13706 / S10) TaxID=768704 RepID=J7IST6_DESMD|nr:hypothetical protein [Desulfosporosinus meridiei]AFQ44927.1 hypothetical protein Desmer_3044 [Desulfosporosinus meridiei DSM 13257]
MRTKVLFLTLILMFLQSANVLAAEKLPSDVLNAFQADIKSFQYQMLEERDKTHHLTDGDIYKTKDAGYKVYRLDAKKVLNEANIDLYDALTNTDKWYIPVTDQVRYIVDKVDGDYKLVGYGVYDEKDAIPYETLEKAAIEKGLNDLVYVDEPALHINGFIGKTAKGSQLLSFNKSDDLKLQKNEIKDGKELIKEIKIKVNDAKTNGNQGFGGAGGFNADSNKAPILFLLLSCCIAIGGFTYKKLKLQK